MIKILFLFLFISSFVWSELKIVTSEEPPQNYTENGELTGIGTDIVKEIQKRINDHSKIDIYPWARAVAISKRNPNTILFLAGRTKDREPYLSFIGPILAKSYKLYGKSNKKYHIDDIKSAKQVDKISCVMDDVREVFMRENNFSNLLYAEDHLQGLQIMLAGKSKLWASSDWENSIQMRNLKKDPSLIKPYYTLYKNFNYIAFNNKTPQKTIRKWDDTLKKIKTDGTIQKIAKKWSKKLGIDLKYDTKTDALVIVE